MTNRTYHPRGVPVDGYAVREHPIYSIWADMLSRCMNKNSPGFSNYGGRGITVAPRWYHFANFAEDMGLRPTANHTIERVDNTKGYCRENCVWDTRSNQCVNRRRFANNTSGFTGVVKINGRYEARFDYEKVRYSLGRFATAIDAAAVRFAFESMFFTDRAAALEMIESETLWVTSSTGVRGVARHSDGGFIVRVTTNGVRHYLGYFKTINEAKDARDRYLASQAR